MKQKIRLTESQLHKVIKESVKSILKEYLGNSSANGYEFKWKTGQVDRNQGGAFGGSSLDIARDQAKYEKEQAAARHNRAGLDNETIKNWYSNNYYDIFADDKRVRYMSPQEAYDEYHNLYNK